MNRRIILIHRIVSWVLVVISFMVIFTGYTASRVWTADVENITIRHIQFKWILIPLFILHVGITMAYFRTDWRKSLARITKDRGMRVHLLRFIQNVTAWFTVIFAILVIVTGLPALDVTQTNIDGNLLFTWHLVLDAFLIISAIIHTGVGLRFVLMRKRVTGRFADYLVFSICIIALSGTILLV
ncbi:MAG: hypothetical protein ACTSWA_02235 [Candidatus Thorarchaeota archaeon]